MKDKPLHIPEAELQLLVDVANELRGYWVMDVDKEIVTNCRTKKHNSDGSLCMVCIDIVETIDPNGLEWVELQESEYGKVSDYLKQYPRG